METTIVMPEATTMVSQSDNVPKNSIRFVGCSKIVPMADEEKDVDIRQSCKLPSIK